VVDAVVVSDGRRTVSEVAADVLAAAGWLSAEASSSD
jgi:hypothetical protein